MSPETQVKLPTIWRQLAWLRHRRRLFRIHRVAQRMMSPRRIMASSLTVFFVIAYLLNGIYILSARQPADPARLMLWLSGGMVIYGIYYCVRCAWSQPTSGLDQTPAEALWIGGAPIRQTDLILNYTASLVPPAIMKTLLLAVVLARDVDRIELMMIGVFISLVLLEIVRTTIACWNVGLSKRGQNRFRIVITSIAVSALVLALASIGANTPARSPTWVYLLNGFSALGHVAANDTIQWLALPWLAPAQLAVAETYSITVIVQIGVSIALLPLAATLLVHVDRWSRNRAAHREQQTLSSGSATRGDEHCESNRIELAEKVEHWIYPLIPKTYHSTLSIAGRHWVSVRRYRWVIFGNFAIPTLLCLSPLATGQQFEQWLYVVGGVGLCTMLLAPPALKIDFRRDLRRMSLVRSLPVSPRSMVIGTLICPVVITWIFQWVTIGVGGWTTAASWNQILMWTGMMNAMAVFTFACENALFLAYPHHEKAEGIGMMIRAKLTFLGKGTVLAAALAALVLWSMICQRLPDAIVQPAFVSGAILAAWLVAGIALQATTACWRRFDLSIDIPPQ